jgi:hypothetical protein
MRTGFGQPCGRYGPNPLPSRLALAQSRTAPVDFIRALAARLKQYIDLPPIWAAQKISPAGEA